MPDSGVVLIRKTLRLDLGDCCPIQKQSNSRIYELILHNEFESPRFCPIQENMFGLDIIETAQSRSLCDLRLIHRHLNRKSNLVQIVVSP